MAIGLLVWWPRDERPAARVASQATPSLASRAPALAVPACSEDCVELAGVVEDVWGASLANATVRAGGARAITSAAGTFSISASRADYIEVSADADGYSLRTLHVDGTAPLVFRLVPEATVSGRVVDQATGAPVPHATVTSGELSTTADGNGQFTIGVDAPYGVVEAHASPRRGMHSLEVGPGDHREDVEIEVEVQIEVRARIEQVGPKPCPEEPAGVRDGDRYVLELSPGRHVIEVGCGQQETVDAVDSDLEVTWRVGAGGIVRGRVMVPGSPAVLGAAEVSVAPDGAGSTHALSVGADGTFTTDAIAPGRYRLHARLGTGPVQSTPPFDVAHGEVVERTIEMVMPVLRPVRGTVWVDGRPAANAHVMFAETSVRTRADGTFATELPEGSYPVEVRFPDVVLRDNVVVGEHGAQLAIPYWTPTPEPPDPPRVRRRFEGRVLDEQGRPLARAVVQCDDEPIVTDVAGQFHCESEAPSPRAIVLHGGASAKTWLDAARTTELRLHRPITGQVVDAEGRPVRAFTIVVRRGTDDMLEFGFSHTAGRFEIEDDGTPATLIARRAGQDGVNPITLDERSTRTGLVLRMRPSSTVRGRIIDGVTQQPLAGVRIHARPDVEWARWFLDPKQVTDEQGMFVIEHVPHGKLLLELKPPQPTWSEQKITVDVASSDLGTLTLARVGRR